MMKKLVATLMLAALALAAQPAAASWTLDSDAGTWTGTNGGTNVQNQTVAVAYGNTSQNQVRWGVPLDNTLPTIDHQSGLGFTGKAAPAVIFELGDPFEIGQIAHLNHEIGEGGSPTEAYLQLTMNFTTPGGPATGTFNFTFGVNETSGLGTDDIISFPSSLPAETVEIGGVTYTLELLGFGASPSTLVSEFVSVENGQENLTLLWGRVTEVPECNEGLSPGYWKNHTADWPAPYLPTQTLGSVFASSADFDLDDVTLGAALAFKGGNTVAEKAQILLRQAVAALLNAAHANINYPLTVAEVIDQVNAALDSGDPDVILDLAGILDGYNNLGADLGS